MGVDRKLLEELRRESKKACDERGILGERVNRVHQAMQMFAPDSNEHRLLRQKCHELEVDSDKAFLKYMGAHRRFRDLLDETLPNIQSVNVDG